MVETEAAWKDETGEGGPMQVTAKENRGGHVTVSRLDLKTRAVTEVEEGRDEAQGLPVLTGVFYVLAGRRAHGCTHTRVTLSKRKLFYRT